MLVKYQEHEYQEKNQVPDLRTDFPYIAMANDMYGGILDQGW